MGDADRWTELEGWYHRCHEATVEQREALLAELRAQDPTMCDELVALLGEATSGASDPLVLGVPALEKAVELSPGDRLGSYRVEAEVGSGGMGKVYRAVRADGQYEQTVAIKVMSSGFLRPDLRDRFRREQQTLVRLNDPRMVRLLDGGVTEHGLEYFVMEYIDGMPIDAFCDERRLTVPERLQLFAQTARAVHAAHRSFVVHRDLKPSNILIDCDGTPKLLDFGIAKSLGQGPQAGDSLTRSGQRLMTPEYASPEQVTGGPITPATDVYALGVILHRLLCGRSPYETDSRLLHSLEQAICEEEPLRPSAAVQGEGGTRVAYHRSTDRRRLRRRLRGPLDTVVSKALAKDPEERYSTAEALADDVQRVVEGKVILAVPPSLLARARRSWRRSRTRISVAAALLLVGSGVWWRTSELSRTAEREAERVEAREEEIGVAQTVVEELLRISTPWSADNPSAEAVDRIVDLLDSGQIRSLETELELRVALARQLLGLDRLEEAQDQLVRAEALGEGAEIPAALRCKVELARIDACFSIGHDREAAERTRTALRRHGETLESSRMLSSLLLRRSRAETNEGLYAEAERTLDQALDLRDGVPDDRLAMEVMVDRSRIRHLQADHAGAERLIREALDLALSSLGSRHPSALNARCHLAAFLDHVGRHEEALEVLDRAERDLRRSMGDDHRRLIRVTMLRGLVLVNMGRHVEAGPCLKRAHERLLALLGTRHPNSLEAMNNLATWSMEDGDLDTAESLLLQALAGMEELHGPDSLETAGLLSNHGCLLHDSGKPEEALGPFRRSLSIRSRRLGAHHHALLATREEMVEALIDLGRHEEAVAEVEIIAAAMDHNGKDRVDLARRFYLVGLRFFDRGSASAADLPLGRSVQLLGTFTPPHVRNYTVATTLWAKCKATLGEFEEAYEILARAEDTLDTAEGDVSEWRAMLEERYALVEAMEEQSLREG